MAAGEQTTKSQDTPGAEDLRTAATPDAAPEELPGPEHDLPPSYPPLRRNAAQAAADPPRQRRRIRGSSILVFIAVVVLAAMFKTFVLQWFAIPSGSMENTLEVGDRVAVTMFDTGEVQRGDVIVFRDPDGWLDVEEPTGLQGAVRDALILIRLLPEDSGHHLIKRVIGLPGDRVVADGTGPITVNGVAVDETYLRPGVSPSDVVFDVTVPEGFVWVMGDNRANSSDSRYHQDDAHSGFVPEGDIFGVARAVLWPVTRIDGLGEGREAFSEVPDPQGGAPAPTAPAREDGA